MVSVVNTSFLFSNALSLSIIFFSPPLATLSSSHPLWHSASICLLPSWRDSLLLVMSISFAGLGIISLQNPFTELASLLVGKGDIRTMLCLLVFFIVSLVLG